MRVKQYWKPLVVIGVVVAAGGFGYWSFYEEPRQALLADLEAENRLNEGLEQSLNELVRVRRELREMGSDTLGSSLDEVDARFRAALQRLAAKSGLSSVQISTTPRDVVNPIGASRRRPPGLPNMSGQVDFRVVRGDLQGSGTLAQVMQAMALLEAQPWVHRVESFSIRPEGRDQERFTLNISASTLLLSPGLAPRDAGEPRIAELEAGASSRWASMIQKNPFREPPPPQQQRTAEAPRPRPTPPPAPPPYNEWRLAGVVESRIGTEAFLVNTRNEERMAIGTGSSVGGAKLVAAEGERAIFEIDGEEYEVFNGQTLEQRRPTNR